MNRILVFILWCFISSTILSAQPIMNSSQTIAGRKIYQDLLKSNKFYFAPSQLKLAYQSDGRPDFQFLSLSYSGNYVNGDQNQIQHTNLLYFTVEQAIITQAELAAIEETLSIQNLELRPLPISTVSTAIVSPLPDGEYLKISNQGSFEPLGNSHSNGAWTKRSFTLRLDNLQAELLLSNIKAGFLPINLGYAFYADVILDNRGLVTIEGDSTVVEELEELAEGVTTLDSLPKKHLIFSDVVSFHLDTSKWKDLIIIKHLSSGIPPSWPAVEIRCYDFNHQLRPDLALKTIELRATGVSSRKVVLPKKRFSSTSPDLHTIQVKFPYAIRMDEPLEYKVTTYTLNGRKEKTDWITLDSWFTLIDLTTFPEENEVKQISMTLEAAPEDWKDSTLTKVTCFINYKLGTSEEQISTTIDRKSELPLQEINFHYQKNTPISYQIIWEKSDGSTFKNELKVLDLEGYEQYLFIAEEEKVLSKLGG